MLAPSKRKRSSERGSRRRRVEVPGRRRRCFPRKSCPSAGGSRPVRVGAEQVTHLARVLSPVEFLLGRLVSSARPGTVLQDDAVAPAPLGLVESLVGRG